jgi:hypothetical protein
MMVGLLVCLVAAAPDGLGWLAVGPVLLGAVVALVMRARGGPAPSLTGTVDAVHPGANNRRIPVAGFPGAVLTLGFVFMFWSGLPIMRPLVVLIAVAGVLLGIVLIVAMRRPQKRSDSLGLTAELPRSSDAERREARRE